MVSPDHNYDDDTEDEGDANNHENNSVQKDPEDNITYLFILFFSLFLKEK